MRVISRRTAKDPSYVDRNLYNNKYVRGVLTKLTVHCMLFTMQHHEDFINNS